MMSTDDFRDRRLFQMMLERIRADPAACRDREALAASCGIDGSEVNRVARDHGHATPEAILLREQMSSARRRLLGTDARIEDIGHEVGFPDEACFQREFRAHAGLTPEHYRALRETADFLIHLPANFRPADPLRYHGRDPAGPAERLSGGTLTKAVFNAGNPILLTLAFEEGSVRCSVRQPGRDHPSPETMAAAHDMTIRMLGLSADADGFEARARSEPEVARLIRGRAGLRMPLGAEPFETLTWAIIGQQINLGFATALRRSLIELAGVEVADAGGMRAHPGPAQIAELRAEDLTRQRFSRSKAEYLIGAARAVVEGSLPLDALAAGSAVLAADRLRAVRGLGPWTTRYVMMRGLGFADCAPIGDSGLHAGLRRFHGLDHRPNAAEAEAFMAGFAPHRSLATCHLWASLNEQP